MEEYIMKKVFKIFLYTNYKKEEDWLNLMSQKGWNLTKKKFFIYYFDDDNTLYTYKKCYLSVKKEKEILKALMMDQKIKIELLCRNGHWYYFRRKSELGEYEAFNDYNLEIFFLTGLRNYMVLMLTFLALFFEFTFGMFQSDLRNTIYLGIYLGIALIICVNFIPALKRLIFLKKVSKK